MLETRRVLDTYLVTSLIDEVVADDVLTLREAVLAANANAGTDQIEFEPTLFDAGPQSILLALGELEITEAVDLTGPGRDDLTIDAGNLSRVLNITAASGDVSLQGLTITGGTTTGDNADPDDNTHSGAGIRWLSSGTLTLTDVGVIGNRTEGRAGGGGIFGNAGTLELLRAFVSENQAAEPGGESSGGGIQALGLTLNLTDSTVQDNTASGDGGGIAAVAAVSLTIDGSSIVNNRSFRHGGGLLVSGVAVYTVNASAIQGNSTSIGDGGGLFVLGGETRIVGSMVEDNQVGTLDDPPPGITQSGGGVAVVGGTLLIEQSTISGNQTLGIGDGGGVFASDAPTLTIDGSQIQNNQSFGRGGGLFAAGTGERTIRDSAIRDNSTLGDGNHGGGLFLEGGETRITRSTLGDNQVGGEGANGGGVAVVDGALLIEQSTISGNRTLGTAGEGGGVFFTQSTVPADPEGVTIRNSTISGNSTSGSEAHGGGIAADSGLIVVEFSTVALNDVSGTEAQGGGIHVSNTADVNLRNSIVAGNTTAFENPELSFGSLTLDLAFNLIGSNQDTTLTPAPVGQPDANGNLIGTSAEPIDPLLGPLEDHGGPTFTHASLEGSPVIGAGDPDAAAGLDGVPEFDQRGAIRVLSRIDIGAYEAPITVPITWANPADIVFGTPLGTTELNATASVAGTFLYSPAAGTILNAGPGQTLSTTFTPTDQLSFLPAEATTTINVLRATPVITWDNPDPIEFGVLLNAEQLDATASVPGSFVYTPPAGTRLEPGADQPLSVTFTPDDPDNFTTATATVSITVNGMLDFGDAPATYPVLRTDDGARHVIVTDFFLGAGVDGEDDGEPSADADADDLDDGVVFTSAVRAGRIATVTITASAAGRLDAWFDFALDGWDESDRIFDNVALVEGANDLSFGVPVNAAADRTFARFRFSTEGGLTPVGLAVDGEVEDYVVTVAEFIPSWHNLLNPLDVNNADGVTPLDALIVINELDNREFSEVGTGQVNTPPAGPPFVDVNDDGFVGPLDALLVINALPSTTSRAAFGAAFGAVPSEEAVLEEAWATIDDFLAGLTVIGVPKREAIEHIAAKPMTGPQGLDAITQPDDRGDRNDIDAVMAQRFWMPTNPIA